ncbi:energy-coupling factor transporter transmembrane component T family protein [Microbacterium gorillae]|uniref:energy-coupling factor transporter transmembrane component T family protein n=1 Tax=Microbacterium gorillae TaxID=1231063 RepID=UPI000693DA9A|nr:energy-coupling factor transporter transmembrane component T [Microbacterium gorillae]
MTALASPVNASPRARGGLLAPRSPLAKLGAALLLALPLIITLDVVSASVALVLGSLFVFGSGLRPREFFLRTLPIWLAAPAAGVTIALYGRPSGAALFDWGFVHVSEGSLQLALATMLRLFAIGLPSIALFATIDPTDLADALSQRLHLPSRFVLGALAGMRLLGLLTDDVRALGLARRARGVADTGRIRRALGTAFALFVLAIRRGTKLSTAMEARGFGSAIPRTWSRPARFTGADAALLVVAALISAIALTAAVVTGAFAFVFAPA